MQRQQRGTTTLGLLSVLLLVLFVGLKLTNVIDWSWWWVTAPMTAPLALIGALLLFSGLMWVLAACFDAYDSHQRAKRRKNAGF